MSKRAEQIADYLSKFLMPIAVVVAAGMIQSAISERSAATQYVEIAARILADKTQDQELRAWAVHVLDRFSAVPFSADLRRELEIGESNLSWKYLTGEELVLGVEISPEEARRRDDVARAKLEAAIKEAREREKARPPAGN